MLDPLPSGRGLWDGRDVGELTRRGEARPPARRGRRRPRPSTRGPQTGQGGPGHVECEGKARPLEDERSG